MQSTTISLRSFALLLLVFFLGACVFSWPGWLLGATLLGTQHHLNLVLLLGGFGPMMAAIGITAWQSGGAGVCALLSQVLRWRFGLAWYLLALFAPGLTWLIAFGLHATLGGTLSLSPFSLLALVSFLIVSCLMLGEEVGWRGYALPRLQARFGALWASLMLAVIWSAWHLPLFLIPGTSFADQALYFGFTWSFLLFLLHNVALSILITWLYNSTGRSLLSVVLFHGGLNTWDLLLPISSTASGMLRVHIFTYLVWVVCALVVLFVAAPTLFGVRRPSARAKDVSEFQR